MPNIKGTETEKNLLNAMKREAVTRTLYYIFANQAKAEGYDYIGTTFEKLAENEKEHAKIWFKWLNANTFPTTFENLKYAIKNETDEANEMYLNYAQKAKEEGFDSLAELFTFVAEIEKSHEDMLKKLQSTIQDTEAQPETNRTFKWICSACGCIIEQDSAPDYCPLCEGEDIFFYKQTSNNK